KSLLSLGPADDSLDVFIIGTILHYDSVLARLIQNPLWTSAKFRAVERWPDRMDLWDRWTEVLLGEGPAAAQTFYQAHRPDMDAGVRICWPGGTTFYKLMTKRARDGKAAFDSEQQNDPLSGDDAPFAECITFWVNRLREWVFYGACDPSLGKAGNRRDPSAILIGGFNRHTGVLDVVEASIRKRLPDRIIEDVITFQAEYRCLLWLVEAVQFQEFMRTELVKRSAARHLPVPARGVTPHGDKDLRILTLQPHMANGLIRLSPDQHTLIEQLRHFPKADHDDGPDALQMLWAAALSGGGQIDYTPVPRSGSDDYAGSFSAGAW
ncbi:phage terminase large subunit, partial [Chromobacterium violaceum]|uniref:phage terminase large subunit n=1 Tax=Chromobacterium violaceum TaxID=536 RepID=UPI0035A6FC58